jgi:hypothetical protein
MKALTRIISVSTIGAILSLLLALFVIRPILADVTVANESLKQKKTELTILDQQILAFKTAQSDLSKAARKDEIANAITPKESLVAAVQDLETAAAKTGTTQDLDVKDPDPAQPKVADVIPGKKDIQEVSYILTTLNDFAGTLNFISYLEHLPHFTEISKITLSAETRQGDKTSTVVRTGRVIGSFNAVFFVKPSQ